MDYLLGQWIRGLVSDAEVQKQLGEHVLELFLAQRDLCEAGTWRQEDAEPGAPGEPLGGRDARGCCLRAGAPGCR